MARTEREELTVVVTDLARGGAGVARAETGEVVFVPYTLPGDRVRVRVRQRKKRFVHAELLEVLEPGPGRQAPRCPAFGRCGGCQWQHVPYELQWQTKVRGVAQALRRVAVVMDGPPDELPATQVWEYRNRVQLHGRGQSLGFHGAQSHDLVAVDRCDLARPELNARWGEARDLGERVGGAYKVELEVLEAGRVRMVWNSPHGAAGFRQVHDEQNRRLQAWVAEAVPQGDVLLDLFGGQGNLSVGLASSYAQVHCVDAAAPRKGRPGTPANVSFHTQDVGEWLRNFPRPEPPVQAASAILDPPRRGLDRDGDKVVAALVEWGVTTAALVSCDPDAFARDASAFLRRGFELERIAVLDLFPQTKHVETLGLLRATSRGAASSRRAGG